MLDEGATPPAAVIGVPVGFVGRPNPSRPSRRRPASPSLLSAVAGVAARWLRQRSMHWRANANDGPGCDRWNGPGWNPLWIGVGPGDIRYLTLRAAALVRDVDVIAFFAKRGLQGNARGIVDPLMGQHRDELRLEYPVTNEIAPEDPSYQEQIGRFYQNSVETLSALLWQGKSVGLLAEGDPFFYGSFMHIWRRLDRSFRSRLCRA